MFKFDAYHHCHWLLNLEFANSTLKQHWIVVVFTHFELTIDFGKIENILTLLYYDKVPHHTQPIGVSYGSV